MKEYGLKQRRLLSVLLVAGLTGSVALAHLFDDPAHAQSFNEVLANTYINNPELNTARANLRFTAESIDQARAGLYPQINVTTDVGRVHSDTSITNDVTRNTATVGLTLRQTVFDGGRNTNSVLQAKYAATAQAEALRGTEQTTLLNAIRAFVDVLRDQSLVDLREQNIDFLDAQVRGAEERLRVGEGNRTDVAQTKARRANAIAILHTTRAQLNASQATFKLRTGLEAKNLTGNTDALIRHLPKDLTQALEWAEAEHPDLQSALQSVAAREVQVRIRQGEHLPNFVLEGRVQRQFNPPAGIKRKHSDSASVYGRLNIPIFQGGRIASRVRQSKAELAQTQLQRDTAQARIRSRIISAWGNYQAARSSIEAASTAVWASQTALEGVLEEQKVGQRATLDVLNTQLELINSRVALENARRDLALLTASLLSATGRLSAQQLALDVDVQPQSDYLDNAHSSWFNLN